MALGSVFKHAPGTVFSARASLLRYAPLVVAATSIVALVPMTGLWLLETFFGFEGVLPSFVVGSGLSIGTSVLLARAWTSFASSQDVVFGELMLWGWLRRLRAERQLTGASDLLGLEGKGWGTHHKLSAEQQRKVLKQLATALESRDRYTHGHSNRVTRYSHAIARGMRLSPELVENIRVAASVHDVGKINIPLEILRKDGGLTDEEFAVMKSHAVKGAEMVAALDSPEVTEMVRHHHERIDGRGYPDGLAGEQIPLGARIISVADTFDAICSTRSYRRACRHKKALAILKKEAGGQLDPDVVEAFSKYYSGRSLPEWWASMSTIPQRVLGSVGRSIERGGTAGVMQGAATVATVVAFAHAPLVAPVKGSVDISRESVVRSVDAAAAPTSFVPGKFSARRDSDGGSRVGGVQVVKVFEPGGALDFLNPENDAGGSGGTTGGDSGSNNGGQSDAPVASGSGGGNSGGGSGRSQSQTSSDGSDPGSVVDGFQGSTGEGDGDSGGGGGGGNGGGGSGGGNNGGGGGGGDSGPSPTDPVDDTVDDVTDTVDDATGGATGDTTDTVDDTVDDTTDTVDDTVDDVTDTVGDATGGGAGGGSGDGGSGSGGSGGGGAGDDVDETVDDTTDTVDDTADDATDTVDDTVGGISPPPCVGLGCSPVVRAQAPALLEPVLSAATVLQRRRL